ncbi:MAG: anthranilate synthase component I family protein [Rhodospirillaceae bacterium]
MTVLSIPYGDPIAAFAPFSTEPLSALLGGCGRYSTLAIRPFRVISADAAGVRVDGVPVAGDPFSVLARELATCPPSAAEIPEPFRTGAIGYFGYELGRHLERLPAARPEDFGIPDMMIGFYDLIAVFDHHERTARVIGNDALDAGGLEQRAHALARQLANTPPLPPLTWPGAAPVWRPEITRRTYESRVAAVIDYIRAGDIFQANFTQGFFADLPPDITAFEIFRRLYALAPAPYAAFLACGAGIHLCCASPELFLDLNADRRVMTRPIKGTRPRGRTPEADRALLAELVASSKDRAENLMICDLLRNDLGRVCEIGSVRVPRLIVPETFAAIHHLVSEVEGRLRPGSGVIDLLRACFPGGSVTGAPKIRAMEIIDALEAGRRGPYCGAIARIGFDGTMDSAVTIRTLSIAQGRVIARAGGGIVADSVPAEEYLEMRTKIAPLLATLGTCHDDDLVR